MHLNRFLVVLAVSATALFSHAAFALAQDEEDPIPNGCFEPVVLDDTGDAYVDDGAGQLPKAVNGHAGPADMDIESANLTYVPGAGGAAGHFVADIGIADLDGAALAPNDSQGGNYYYLFLDGADGVEHFVKAVIASTGGDPTYSYGSISSLGAGGVGLFSVYATDGTTPGRLVKGPHGHVLMDIPAAWNLTLGNDVTGVFANADGIVGKDDYYGLNNHIDTAPDGVDTNKPASGATIELTDCSQVPPPA